MRCEWGRQNEGGILKPLPAIQEIEPSKIFCNAIVEERPREALASVGPATGAGIWLVDRNMRVLWMNKEMESIYGSRAEIEGKNCFSAFRNRSSKCPDCLPTKAFETKNIMTGYIKRVTADGVQRYYQLIEAPMFDENNDVSRVMEIVLDITERARLEQSLRTSEAEYRALFERAGTAVSVIRPDGIFAKVNDVFEALSGYRKEELINKAHYLLFVHPRDRERIDAYHRARLVDSTSAPAIYEFSFVNRWGAERTVHISVSAMPSGEQISSLIDLTDQRKLEQEVRSKEQFLANILRYSVDAIVALDENGRIRSWNHGADLMFGYGPREMIGKRFTAILAEEVRRSREFKEVQEQFQKKGFLRNYVVPAVTKDERRITIEITRTAIRDETGKDLGSSAIIRDITEKLRSEQRMIQQEKMLALGELAASLAHEVKNPLNSMVINMEVMRGHLANLSGNTQAALQKYLDVLSSEVQRLNKVMRGVLDFARPIEGDLAKVSLESTLEHVIALVNAGALKKKIKIRLAIEKNLPAVDAVEDHLKQIFLNLILNAFEAMPKGGALMISAERNQENGITLEISDNGIGIPRKNLNRIFDLYFSTKEKGSGLGLALAQRLIRSMGGTIHVKSRVKHGTKFTITLPTS